MGRQLGRRPELRPGQAPTRRLDICHSAFVEQDALYQLGAGLADTSSAQFQRLQTPVATMNCPTRRAATVFLMDPGMISKPVNAPQVPSAVARADYAANTGDTGLEPGSYWGPDTPFSSQAQEDAYNWVNTGRTGISFRHSEVRLASISDGTSNTYCLGEKLMNADWYLTGQDGGDDWNMYTGYQDDIVRVVAAPASNPSPPMAAGFAPLPPMQDQPAYQSARFGSAHSGGLNMSLCDGSVRTISYSIDPEVHRRLGNREDGLPIDGNGF